MSEHCAEQVFRAKHELSDRCLVDAHVHIHRCFDLATFFSVAHANFRKAAVSHGLPSSIPGVLMLAETPAEDAFARAGEWLESGGEGEWELEPTDERISLVARANDGFRLIIVAGRQVVTHEGVEVLGLGVDRDLPFHLSLEDTVGVAVQVGAIPVVPWGFGKWWFGRGRRVRELVEDPPIDELFLGDNAGRPRSVLAPRPFVEAANRGVLVLPGTDPLPLECQVGAVGSYGSILEGTYWSAKPGEMLTDHLRRISRQPAIFGHRVTVASFFRNQFGLRYRRIQMEKR